MRFDWGAAAGAAAAAFFITVFGCAPLPAAPAGDPMERTLDAIALVESGDRPLPCGRGGCGRYQVTKRTGRMLGYTPAELVADGRAAARDYLSLMGWPDMGAVRRYHCGPRASARRCRAYERRVVRALDSSNIIRYNYNSAGGAYDFSDGSGLQRHRGSPRL